MKCYVNIVVNNTELCTLTITISMGKRKKDVTPLLTHWSYVFLA